MKVDFHQIKDSEEIRVIVQASDRTWIFMAQWKQLWKAADVTQRLVLALAGGMGLRRFEIAQLNLGDIEGNVMTIYGKGSGPQGKVTKKEVPPTVLRCISEYMPVREKILAENGDYANGNLLVMESVRRGAPATLRFVETTLHKLSEATGIKLTCHTLRRFYCMALIDSGTEIDTVRRMMRHESIITTYDCYVRADPRKIANATTTVEDAIFG